MLMNWRFWRTCSGGCSRRQVRQGKGLRLKMFSSMSSAALWREHTVQETFEAEALAGVAAQRQGGQLGVLLHAQRLLAVEADHPNKI